LKFGTFFISRKKEMGEKESRTSRPRSKKKGKSPQIPKAEERSVTTHRHVLQRGKVHLRHASDEEKGKKGGKKYSPRFFRGTKEILLAVSRKREIVCVAREKKKDVITHFLVLLVREGGRGEEEKVLS